MFFFLSSFFSFFFKGTAMLLAMLVLVQ